MFSRVHLQAELNKIQLGELGKLFETQSLDKDYIPDFLLHSPGDFTQQEFVIEVKSDPHIKFLAIQKDLGLLGMVLKKA